MDPARDDLKFLASSRRKRLQSNGRPGFDLTEGELKRSTQTAMRLASGTRGGTICLMTTREKAHALLDEMSDAELDEVVKLIEVRHEAGNEPEMAELPESWRTFEDGTPVPNWVAAVHEAREGR